MIELVLNTQPLGNEDVEIRPHSLVIHSYKTPTFCDVCKEMLFGMFKQASKRKSQLYLCNSFLVQGLKCEYCGLNIHKKCVKYLPNDCSHKKKRRNSLVGSTNSNSSLGYQSSISSSVDGDLWPCPEYCNIALTRPFQAPPCQTSWCRPLWAGTARSARGQGTGLHPTSTVREHYSITPLQQRTRGA